MGRTRDSIDRMFEERNMKPNVSMELDSSELLKRFVSAGVGIGFCPYSTALGDVRLGITAIVKLTDAADPPRHGAGLPQGQGSQPRLPGLHRYRRPPEIPADRAQIASPIVPAAQASCCNRVNIANSRLRLRTESF